MKTPSEFKQSLWGSPFSYYEQVQQRQQEQNKDYLTSVGIAKLLWSSSDASLKGRGGEYLIELMRQLDYLRGHQAVKFEFI